MKTRLVCLSAIALLVASSLTGRAGTEMVAPSQDQFGQAQNAPGYWVPAAPAPVYYYPAPAYVYTPPPPYYYGPPPGYYGPRYYGGPGPVVFGPSFFFGFGFHGHGR